MTTTTSRPTRTLRRPPRGAEEAPEEGARPSQGEEEGVGVERHM